MVVIVGQRWWCLAKKWRLNTCKKSSNLSREYLRFPPFQIEKGFIASGTWLMPDEKPLKPLPQTTWGTRNPCGVQGHLCCFRNEPDMLHHVRWLYRLNHMPIGQTRLWIYFVSYKFSAPLILWDWRDVYSTTALTIMMHVFYAEDVNISSQVLCKSDAVTSHGYPSPRFQSGSASRQIFTLWLWCPGAWILPDGYLRLHRYVMKVFCLRAAIKVGPKVVLIIQPSISADAGDFGLLCRTWSP